MKEHIEILLEDLDAEKCQLFDVREIREWQISRLKQAILQPLSFLKKGLLYQETNREKKTYLHCSFGKRVYPASFFYCRLWVLKKLSLYQKEYWSLRK